MCLREGADLLVLAWILSVFELHRGGLLALVIFFDAFVHDLGIGVIALWIFFQHRVVLFRLTGTGHEGQRKR